MVHKMVDLMLVKEDLQLPFVDFVLEQELDHRDVDKEFVDWLGERKYVFNYSN